VGFSFEPRPTVPVERPVGANSDMSATTVIQSNDQSPPPTPDDGPAAATERASTDPPQSDEIAPAKTDWTNPRVAAILEAAAVCFARKGFAATTLADIGKELGLRKSIVHYYFENKAALIHEVQSYTYHRYLEHVQAALAGAPAPSAGQRSTDALLSLWNVREKTNVGLSIEVWSASRNDDELRRRAASLLDEKRRLVTEGIRSALGNRASDVHLDAVSTLILAVLDGLSVADFLEGQSDRPEAAYRLFLYLLRLGVEDLGGAE
jgi:AcrR family transcriptional regulator